MKCHHCNFCSSFHILLLLFVIFFFFGTRKVPFCTGGTLELWGRVAYWRITWRFFSPLHAEVYSFFFLQSTVFVLLCNINKLFNTVHSMVLCVMVFFFPWIPLLIYFSIGQLKSVALSWLIQAQPQHLCLCQRMAWSLIRKEDRASAVLCGIVYAINLKLGLHVSFKSCWCEAVRKRVAILTPSLFETRNREYEGCSCTVLMMYCSGAPLSSVRAIRQLMVLLNWLLSACSVLRNGSFQSDHFWCVIP